MTEEQGRKAEIVRSLEVTTATNLDAIEASLAFQCSDVTRGRANRDDKT